MGWIVQYTGKDGKPARSAVFGSDVVATSYARTVKDGKVVPSTVSAPQVDVQKVPDGSVVDSQRREELARLADRLEAQAREREAEAYAETGAQARLAGASIGDALDDARDQAAFVYQDALDVAEPIPQACAGGCGRTVKRGFTTCRTCAKGL